MSPVRHHTIQQRMIETIDRQLASGSRSPWVLKMGPEKLRMVRSFVLSFTVEPSDRVIPYMSFPEPEGVETADPREPADIEVIAERLAKVEQRQDEFEQRTIKALNAHDERFDTQSELRIRSNRALDQRIDKVAEIIGERVSGLVDEIAAVQDLLGEKSRSPGALYYASRIAQLADAVRELNPGWRGWKGTDSPAFPTGGAGTAEAAAEVVPVPQRGDRVRLEGARSTGGTTLTGWYEVTGRGQQFPGDRAQFQVGSVGSMGLYWVYDTDPGLKEVRHAQP